MSGGAVVLLTSLGDGDVEAVRRLIGDVRVARDLDGLHKALDAGADRLLSFETGVIVPDALIGRFTGGAYNLHAASPDYPGRDPHHFAVYDGAARYGATLHRMTARVDDGPIVDVELFDTPAGVTPRELLALARGAAFRILERAGPALARGEPLQPRGDWRWGPVKRTRADFLAMCRIEPGMSAQEVERRYRAFDGEGHDNLVVQLHGRTFRIEKRP